MNLRAFLQECKRLIKVAVKPSRSELWLSIKVCFLGIALVGAIGFLIKLVSTVLQTA
jgi:protein translocase SEC61 complex gamma subunit